MFPALMFNVLSKWAAWLYCHAALKLQCFDDLVLYGQCSGLLLSSILVFQWSNLLELYFSYVRVLLSTAPALQSSSVLYSTVLLSYCKRSISAVLTFLCSTLAQLQCPMSNVQCSNTPMFQSSNVLLFYCSSILLFYCSKIDSFEELKILMFYCSSVLLLYSSAPLLLYILTFHCLNILFPDFPPIMLLLSCVHPPLSLYFLAFELLLESRHSGFSHSGFSHSGFSHPTVKWKTLPSTNKTWAVSLVFEIHY